MIGLLVLSSGTSWPLIIIVFIILFMMVLYLRNGSLSLSLSGLVYSMVAVFSSIVGDIAFINVLLVPYC